MAPTEYRVIAKRATLRPLAGLRGLVAAGEALNPEVLRAWHEATGLWIRDGYGQTETGQLTGTPLGETPRPGLDGPRRCPGVAARRRRRRARRRPRDRSRRSSSRYLGDDAAPRRPVAHRRPRHAATRTATCYFEGRTDDVIISAGYRIGPFEVESALVAHAAVAEAAVVAAPDDERGASCAPSSCCATATRPPTRSPRELQDHVKAQTAPYKYPRIVDFAAELPKTRSGKVRRALLREQG